MFSNSLLSQVTKSCSNDGQRSSDSKLNDGASAAAAAAAAAVVNLKRSRGQATEALNLKT